MPKRALNAFLAFAFAASAIAATPAAPPRPAKLHLNWDLVLRYDNVKDIPAKPYAYSYDRWHLQVRPGASYTFNSFATLEGRLALQKDSEPNHYYPLADEASGYYGYKLGWTTEHGHLLYGGREDNFTPNSVTLDRLNLQLRPTASTYVAIGRFENPFDYTQAIWDVDLQPQGVAATWDLGAQDRFHSRIAAATFYRTQQYGDNSVIYGGQYTAMTSSQWPVSAELSLAYYDFTHLYVLGRKNFRSNSTVLENGVREFASDFEIGDALLRLHSDRWYPVDAWYDRIHNFGAAPGAGSDGVDTGFRVGQIAGPGTFRFSYIYQDLQRDAVMDSFNGDDWYLHSWYRGSLYRLGVGLWRDFSVQATYMDMRHHETDFHTTRWMFDLVKRW